MDVLALRRLTTIAARFLPQHFFSQEIRVRDCVYSCLLLALARFGGSVESMICGSVYFVSVPCGILCCSD